MNLRNKIQEARNQLNDLLDCIDAHKNYNEDDFIDYIDDNQNYNEDDFIEVLKLIDTSYLKHVNK